MHPSSGLLEQNELHAKWCAMDVLESSPPRASLQAAHTIVI